MSEIKIFMSNKVPLTEREKIQMLWDVEKYGHQWKYIGEKRGRSADTVKSFYKTYMTFGTISPKRGRPKEITDELKEMVVQDMLDNPLQSLQSAANKFDAAKSTIKKILNENRIEFFKRTPVSPLTEEHKNKRLEIVSMICSVEPRSLPPIVFTDESSIYVDLEKGGIWRLRGFYPPECFYEKKQAPVHIMVWGGIGPRGNQRW